MKTIIPFFAMMFLVGCGNNSMNQSGSANSMSDEPPTSPSNTNDMSTNSLTTAVTNAPMITNGAGANLPTTNQ